MDYYVDPSSTQVTELGTQVYPYKSLGMVFVELLNFMSNSNAQVKIHLKEQTAVFLENDLNYLINLESVQIDSYSDSSGEADQAIIVETDSPVPLIHDSTRFMPLTSADLDTTIVSDVNAGYLEDEFKVILAHNTSFMINNTDLYSNFSDIQVSFDFVEPVGVQSNSIYVSFDHMFVQISGGVMGSTEILTMYFHNVVFDYYQANYALNNYAH